VTRTPVESAIIGSILFSFVVNIPTWMELSVEPCFSDRFNRPSQLIANLKFFDYISGLLQPNPVGLIP
jgi:hypothetical protein